MADLPATLTPSKCSAYKNCPQAFKFSVIDHIREEPSEPSVRGTLVHAALERLMLRPAQERDKEAAIIALHMADIELRSEVATLNLDDDEADEFHFGALRLLLNYFEMEDPTKVTPVGLEVMLATEFHGTILRGIIDRLDLVDGDLIVNDYKTGHSPKERYEQSRIDQVNIYALLCERVIGVRPVEVRLLYLGDGVVVSSHVTPGTIRGTDIKVGALWTSIERACNNDKFLPRKGPLCNFCSFKPICPAWN